MIDVVTLGEALIAIRTRDLLTSTRGRLSLAGAESNVAIGLARLGHACQWVGVIGDDPAGALVRRTLRAEGVDTSGIRVASDAPTATMLVDHVPALAPHVTYYRSASAGSTIRGSDISPEVLSSARMLHVTGITPALSQSAAEATTVAIAGAAAAGIRISFDVNYRSKLWSRAAARERLSPLARSADVVIASEDELDLVADGATEQARCAALFDAGVTEVVIKRGHRGATLVRAEDDSNPLSVPAITVTVVSTIGAGDAFTAGYLSGRLDALPPEDRMRRAVACGAFAVTGDGDWEQAPDRARLKLLDAGGDEAHR